jgi:hypothetical protein
MAVNSLTAAVLAGGVPEWLEGSFEWLQNTFTMPGSALETFALCAVPGWLAYAYARTGIVLAEHCTALVRFDAAPADHRCYCLEEVHSWLDLAFSKGEKTYDVWLVFPFIREFIAARRRENENGLTIIVTGLSASFDTAC